LQIGSLNSVNLGLRSTLFGRSGNPEKAMMVASTLSIE
jgi:hypothetical protein